MRRVQIKLFVGLAINILIILGFVFYVPYYVNGEGLSITLFNANTELSARLLGILVFTVLSLTLTQFLVLISPKLMDIKFVHYFCKTFPMYPILSLLVWLFLELIFSNMKEYEIASLGFDFVNANISSYGSNMTHSDFVSIGESLTVGLGVYLIWLLAFMLIAQYVWYYRKFTYLYRLDEIKN